MRDLPVVLMKNYYQKKIHLITMSITIFLCVSCHNQRISKDTSCTDEVTATCWAVQSEPLLGGIESLIRPCNENNYCYNFCFNYNDTTYGIQVQFKSGIPVGTPMPIRIDPSNPWHYSIQYEKLIPFSDSVLVRYSKDRNITFKHIAED